MSLTNRFSTLLLVTLGLTLAGFSTALVVSSRIYLNRQIEDRLTAIFTLLKTCVEAKPGWVRWEPREKRLPPSRWNERHATTWLVCDGDGRLLTDPKHLPYKELPQARVSPAGVVALPERLTDLRGRSWRVAQLHVRPTVGRVPRSERPGNNPLEGKSYHDEVVLSAFVSLDETEADLTTLAWFLVAISALVWALAALCARWLSRKTLVPLTRLVESAQKLDVTNPGWILAEVGTRDELDDLRRAFNDLLARLHEAYDRQRRFSSLASHQLRTPVAVMIGHLEVAQRHERPAAHYRRVIQLAHKRAVDLGQIVESLLFLSRADSTTLTRSETFDIGRWLLEYMASRPVSPRTSDIAINLDIDIPLWVKAQRHLFGQVVENLLDNACKYSQPGRPIVVSAARDGDFALLAVEDSGRGITPEDLSRIFEPFFRSSPGVGESVPGVGLGLSVVERIVDAFGGTVAAVSEPGSGSRFELRLPLTTAPFREPAAAAPRARAVTRTGHGF
jgi:signal transduction histidine kinase